jgi:PDZ domain-containing protein
MALTLRGRAPWWMYVVASVYVLTLCFNASREAFGPADSGLRYRGRLPDHRPLEVEEVVPGSPFDEAGIRAGDVIETVGGHEVLGQTDWFVARAHFQRGEPTEIQVQRGENRLQLWFTITTPNWRTLDRGVIAFQIARVVTLVLAVVIAFARPQQVGARLAALMFAMIAVAEAFPPAGWAAGLRQLPPLVALPIAAASVSWLLITVAWLSLSLLFPTRLSVSRWLRRFWLIPVVIYVPLIMTSAVAFVYRIPTLAMPSPFLDTAEIRSIQSIWGVMPSLFINPWPAYQPDRQVWLIGMWVVVSLLFWTAGCALLLVNSCRVRDESERRRSQVLVFALAATWLLAVHNIVIRNWRNVFDTDLPNVLSFGGFGFVAEAVVFSSMGFVLTYMVLKHHEGKEIDGSSKEDASVR